MFYSAYPDAINNQDQMACKNLPVWLKCYEKVAVRIIAFCLM